jgi:DNA-binding NarL/FixJ family response regulator
MKLLLVDDHGLFRGGLRMLLSALQHDLEILEAESCQEATAMMHLHSDIRLCLVDLRLRDENGMHVLAVLKEVNPAIIAVVVSGDEAPDSIYAALDAGAMGYVPKSVSPPIMVQALKLVLAGGIYLPPSLLAFKRQDRQQTLPPNGAQELTARQREVLQGLLRGWPNKLISRHLDISDNTLKGHLAAIYRILEVRSRSQAVIAASLQGFVVGLDAPPHETV